jgi:hypothetical protein
VDVALEEGSIKAFRTLMSIRCTHCQTHDPRMLEYDAKRRTVHCNVCGKDSAIDPPPEEPAS